LATQFQLIGFCCNVHVYGAPENTRRRLELFIYKKKLKHV